MRTVLFTALLALATAAAAAAGPAAVYEETSSPGEAMDQFVARISPRAVATTEQNRVMHCGVIGQSGDRYSIRIGTSGTWQSCRIDLTNTVDGFASTGVTFRTATSDQDSKRGFTDTDFKRPRGYIAYDGVVRYQEGRTKDRPVSTR
ncbi:hypothetical protein LQE85_08835 [Stenotrophomonas rhizophila]|uniref:hypothetical protein n=1 Tax=Stenotrophomonas rhizophila TaxID=216778 RepID=UPI00201CF362|nr:hypothetical protein [Stenotrophomonas rhizophila]UQY89287.1 hypothetical protein LQE85_08835 [Stenotrophomonas rhizophila]